MHRYMSDFCEHSENLNKKSDKIFASAPTVTDSVYKQRIRLILAQCILFKCRGKGYNTFSSKIRVEHVHMGKACIRTYLVRYGMNTYTY